MAEWRLLKRTVCLNCNEPVYGRPNFKGYPIVVSGCEPMEFKHVGDDCSCGDPKVYSIWSKYHEWLEACDDH